MPEGIEYQRYKDSNGVTWGIYETARTMFAYASPDQEIVYLTEPEDLQAGKPSMADSASKQEIAERDRATFTKLRKEIENYAAAHRGKVQVRVKAGNGGAVLFGLVVAAAYLLAAPRRRR